MLADIGGTLAASVTFESQANLASWIDVISGLIGGIKLLAFPAITRWLARVERRLLLRARNRPSAARTTSSRRPPATPQWYDRADSSPGTMPSSSLTPTWSCLRLLVVRDRRERLSGLLILRLSCGHNCQYEGEYHAEFPHECSS